MPKKLKVLTLIGTRPEIIRLSRTMIELDKQMNQVLVHTGQNYDYELNEIFFKELGLRKPDYFLDAAGKTAAETAGNVIKKTDDVLEKEKPDAFLVLGDTNSCLGAYAAKRRKIPVFHMEAGNRCFDQRVPEEINRKIIDHMSDVNMVYSDLARLHLIAEGFPIARIIKTGSPMKEVLDAYAKNIETSDVLKRLKLVPQKYFVLTAHREENVSSDKGIKRLAETLRAIDKTYKMPIVFSAHPRTRKRLEALRIKLPASVRVLKPFGFFDFVALETQAFCTISDSGTINEEASILNFPAINIRDAHERPEAADEATTIMTGLSPERVLQGIELVRKQARGASREFRLVNDYAVDNVSKKVARTIVSYRDYIKQNVWKEMPE